MKKAVIFDLGNVLVTVDNTLTLAVFQRYIPEYYQVDELEMVLYGHVHNLWYKAGEKTKVFEQFNLGLISAETFYAYLKKTLRFSDTLTFTKFRNILA